MVGERYAELLVQLLAVFFVGVGEQADDVTQRFDEGSELGLRELAAGDGASELGLERLAFAFDFGDPFDERSELGVGFVEGGPVLRQAAVAIGDLLADGGVAFFDGRVELVVAGECVDGAFDVLVELVVEESVETVDDGVLFDVDALRVVVCAGVLLVELAAVVGLASEPVALHAAAAHGAAHESGQLVGAAHGGRPSGAGVLAEHGLGGFEGLDRDDRVVGRFL